MTVSKPSVAEFLVQKLATCGKSQREVAREIGYENPNIITMFKQGSTKVPYNMIGSLAGSIDADPAFLLRLAMQEYDPQVWRTIEVILAVSPVVTADEREFLDFAREVGGGAPLAPETPECRELLGQAIRSVVSTRRRRAEAAVAALNRLPRNARHARPS